MTKEAIVRWMGTMVRRTPGRAHCLAVRRRGLPGANCPAWLRPARSENAATLVELALSVSILLSLIFGMIAFCMALYSYNYICNAARAGTRFAIVRGSSCPGNIVPSACPATQADVQAYIQNLGYPGIYTDSNHLFVTATWPDSGPSCTPSAVPCNNPGNLVQVKVTYLFPLQLPFISTSTLTLSSTSQMVISQ
jgi:Flp pilus assembly protein TadG